MLGLSQKGHSRVGRCNKNQLVRADTSIEMIATELEPHARFYGYHSGTQMAVMLAVVSDGVLQQARTIVEVAERWVL